MSDHNQTEKITLELTKEQSEFLNWATELEGVSAEDYLLRAVKGQIYKSGEAAQPDSRGATEAPRTR
jgi:hypothetical protein